VAKISSAGLSIVMMIAEAGFLSKQPGQRRAPNTYRPHLPPGRR
jgi:hypothetical protein